MGSEFGNGGIWITDSADVERRAIHLCGAGGRGHGHESVSSPKLFVLPQGVRITNRAVRHTAALGSSRSSSSSGESVANTLLINEFEVVDVCDPINVVEKARVLTKTLITEHMGENIMIGCQSNRDWASFATLIRLSP